MRCDALFANSFATSFEGRLELIPFVTANCDVVDSDVLSERDRMEGRVVTAEDDDDEDDEEEDDETLFWTDASPATRREEGDEDEEDEDEDERSRGTEGLWRSGFAVSGMDEEGEGEE